MYKICQDWLIDYLAASWFVVYVVHKNCGFLVLLDRQGHCIFRVPQHLKGVEGQTPVDEHAYPGIEDLMSLLII